MKKSDFEILFDEAVNGMAFVSPAGEWLHVNKSFCDMLGYTQKELLNIDFQSITHPDDLPEDIVWIDKALKGEETYLTRDKRYIHKKGHPVWVDIKVTLCRKPDQTPKYYIAQIADITKRKKIEYLKERTQSKLEQVMNAAVDGIIMANSSGRIESFNKGAELLFGWSPQEAIGQPLSIIMSMEDGAHHQGHIENFLQSGRSKIIGMSRELKGKKKDGTLFPVKLSLSSTLTDGEIFFVAVIHDISDIKSIQQQLLDQKYAAEYANHAKSEFLSNMSHELRTPLNAILGFAQILKMNKTENLEENQIGQIDQIMQGGEHLLELVNEILDMARIEAGRMEFDYKPVNVTQLINRAISTVKPMASSREINLRTCVKGKSCEIWVDEKKCYQVIVNLLSNAVKYNHDHGWIEVNCLNTKAGNCRITIEDNGEGISKENQIRVFQPFERFSNRNTYIEGTGVGLTLSKSLVENMQGEIGFKSEFGKGSTFWVEFPHPADSSCCDTKPIN